MRKATWIKSAVRETSCERWLKSRRPPATILIPGRRHCQLDIKHQQHSFSLDRVCLQDGLSSFLFLRIHSSVFWHFPCFQLIFLSCFASVVFSKFTFYNFLSVGCDNDKTCASGYYCHIQEDKEAGFCTKGRNIDTQLNSIYIPYILKKWFT